MVVDISPPLFEKGDDLCNYLPTFFFFQLVEKLLLDVVGGRGGDEVHVKVKNLSPEVQRFRDVKISNFYKNVLKCNIFSLH